MSNVIVQRSNRLGIPVIGAQGKVVENGKTIFLFNNHVNLNDNFIGEFLVKFNEVIDAASTNPVIFRTIGVVAATCKRTTLMAMCLKRLTLVLLPHQPTTNLCTIECQIDCN